MAYTEKQGQYSIEYAKKNLKRIPLDVKREYYDEVIVKAAEKEGPRHIPPYSPVQRAEHPVPDLLTGSYTRPKSPIEPELPSDDTFIGYFDKQ